MLSALNLMGLQQAALLDYYVRLYKSGAFENPRDLFDEQARATSFMKEHGQVFQTPKQISKFSDWERDRRNASLGVDFAINIGKTVPNPKVQILAVTAEMAKDWAAAGINSKISADMAFEDSKLATRQARKMDKFMEGIILEVHRLATNGNSAEADLFMTGLKLGFSGFVCSRNGTGSFGGNDSPQ